MFRGAILGAGNVALLGHVPGWQARSDVTIVAAADARPGAEAAVREALPDARFYRSAEELYAKETLDFVDVAAPPATHAALAGEALERSLHVLCEKPLVLSSADLLALTALATRKERALVTVHNWLYAEPILRAREIVASGALGDVRRVAWSVVRKEPARVASGGGVNWRLDPSVSGGGISVDHGWHALYAVRSLLLDDWTSVSARFEKRRFTELLVEDTATLSLRSDRVWAEIFLTWAGDERSNRIEVEGSRGRVIVEGTRVFVDGALGASEEALLTSLADGSQHPEWFAGVAQLFVGEMTDSARRGGNLAEAALCVKTLEAARASSEAGGAWRPVA